MKEWAKMYFEVLEIIKNLSEEEVKGEKIPDDLSSFPKALVVLAYENFITKNVDLDRKSLEEEVVEVSLILETLNKKEFLGGKLPEELERFSYTAIRIAYKMRSIDNKSIVEKSQKISKKGGYWCARDLKSSPIGNHHFFLLVVDKDLNIFGDNKVEEKGKIKFYTFGGFDKGKLKEIVNNKTDVKSVNEKTYWWKPDLDLEAHRIEEIKESDYDSLIKNLSNYDYNQNNKGVPQYDLTDCNCASWVNVFLESIGISQYLREKYGEFNGIDWGEEDAFDPKYFIEKL